MTQPLPSTQRIVYVAGSGEQRQVWYLPENLNPAELATKRGWVDSEWGTFNIGDFGGNEDEFQQSWTIGGFHSVSFNVEAGRQMCLRRMRIGRTSGEGFGSYDWAFIISQSVLPAEERVPEIQALFDLENARAASFQEARANIMLASTPGELWNIALPWVETDPNERIVSSD